MWNSVLMLNNICTVYTFMLHCVFTITKQKQNKICEKKNKKKNGFLVWKCHGKPAENCPHWVGIIREFFPLISSDWRLMHYSELQARMLIWFFFCCCCVFVFSVLNFLFLVWKVLSSSGCSYGSRENLHSVPSAAQQIEFGYGAISAMRYTTLYIVYCGAEEFPTEAAPKKQNARCMLNDSM